MLLSRPSNRRIASENAPSRPSRGPKVPLTPAAVSGYNAVTLLPPREPERFARAGSPPTDRSARHRPERPGLGRVAGVAHSRAGPLVSGPQGQGRSVFRLHHGAVLLRPVSRRQQRKMPRQPGTIGYGRAVYFSWNSDERRLPYLCQIGVGLPALPALLQANWMNNHRKVAWDGFMAPPRPINMPPDDPNYDQPTAHDLNKLLNRYFEIGGPFHDGGRPVERAGDLRRLGGAGRHPASRKERKRRRRGTRIAHVQPASCRPL